MDLDSVEKTEHSSIGPVQKALLILTTALQGQNYLGAWYIPMLFKLVPQKFHRKLAFNVLAISPHYYRLHEKPEGMSRDQFIQSAHETSINSRQLVARKYIQPHLNTDMLVLDYGCGPGYLASEVSKHCQQVTAIDISSGVIACAKAIHHKSNIQFRVIEANDLSSIPDSSLDLVYSTAVMLHVRDDVCRQILSEFMRVLKPEGKAICEFLTTQGRSTDGLPTNHNGSEQSRSLLKNVKEKYSLLVVPRPLSLIEEIITGVGFEFLTRLNKDEPEDKNAYYAFGQQKL
ncbi:Ubiquinone biosynthesis O-methyltransferase [Acaryochloris thomasi RCC1774]|uniref:Ubiquinone biosynthesis O-methyltransferase n=1 Tax=Acaryochloris thomasi RCC1774 TaxID=1764569 RepID=A0A2W1JFL9_9CYAN|nr:class I SAM-dependent methyltransferase [Acaryochloris thomasi]PZD72246.1 Ubiquinone biosynthesis O-methyltransferase [Acaryochloris thomasi RCC1774]